MSGSDTHRFLERFRAKQQRVSTSAGDATTGSSVIEAIDILVGPDRGARALALAYLFGNGDRPAVELAPEEDGEVAGAIRRSTEDGPLEPSELIGLVGSCRGSQRHMAVLAALEVSVAQRGIGDADLSFLLSTVAAMGSVPAGDEASSFARISGTIGRSRLIEALDEPGPRRLGAIRLLAGG